MGARARLRSPTPRKGSAVLRVPEQMVKRWESAYRFYQEANLIAGSGRVSEVAVADMVRASREVATAWRAFSYVDELPWWAVAAVATAAQAFEGQAREWERRARPGGD